MTAKYRPRLSCTACADEWTEDSWRSCESCVAKNTYDVEVLKIGVGFFGDKAVIKKISNGELLTVPISRLYSAED